MEVNSNPKVIIDCGQGLLKAVRFNENGRYALTCGTDRSIKLWNPTKSLLLETYKGHSSEVIDCQSNHDSSQFCSCSNDRSLIVWDVEKNRILRRFRHVVIFNNVCYGPESSTVLTSSIDGVVRIYDIRAVNSWEPIQQLVDAKDSVTCCKVTSNNEIVTCSLDKCVRFYDIRNGKLAIDTLNFPVGHISVSQSNLCLLVTCLRGPLVMIDRENPQVLNQFKGNVNELFRLESEFLLNDFLIASGSEDGRVYVWDTLESSPKQALDHKVDKCHNRVIQSLSSDNLDNLLSACGHKMYLWEVS